MSDTVLTAIIGGIFAVSVAIVGFYRTRQDSETSVLVDLVEGISTLNREFLSLSEAFQVCQEELDQARSDHQDEILTLKIAHRGELTAVNENCKIKTEGLEKENRELLRENHELRVKLNGLAE